MKFTSKELWVFSCIPFGGIGRRDAVETILLARQFRLGYETEVKRKMSGC